MNTNILGVVVCLDKDVVACFDEDMVACLDEGVLAFLDKNNKHDLNLDISHSFHVCF